MKRTFVVLSLALALLSAFPAGASHLQTYSDSRAEWTTNSDLLGRGTANASAESSRSSGAVRAFSRADQQTPAGFEPVETPYGAFGVGSSLATSRAMIIDVMSVTACSPCVFKVVWELTKAETAYAAGGPLSMSRAEILLNAAIHERDCEMSICFNGEATIVPAGPGRYEATVHALYLSPGAVIEVEASLSLRSWAKGTAFAMAAAEGSVRSITIE